MDKHPRASRSVAVTGAALLCGAVAQRLATRDSLRGLHSPLLVKFFRQFGITDEPRSRFAAAKPSIPTSNRPKTALLFALALTAATWYRSEEHIVVLFPALTPLLLARIPHLSNLDKTESPPLLSLLSLPTSALVAAFSCFALARSHGTSVISFVVCVGVVGILYASYLALSTPQATASTINEEGRGEFEDPDPADGVDIEEVAYSWAFRIVPALVVALLIRTFGFHAPNDSWARTAVVGFFKALAWLLIFKSTRYSSWTIASTIGTFSIAASRNPYIQISDIYASRHVVASVLSLAQTTRLLPKNAKKTGVLWALALVPIWPFLANVYDIYMSTVFLPGAHHPVEGLARTATARFEAMLERQSRNYTAAEKEYRHRYGLSPPPGFESWFNYAIAHNSAIIDEFDMIHEAIAPFLKLSGRRVREAMREAVAADDINLWSCEFQGTTGSTTCRNDHRSFDRHIGESLSLVLGGVNVRESIPDIQFLANHLDEPRVMLPNPKMFTGDERIKVRRFGHDSALHDLIENCPQEQLRTSQERGMALQEVRKEQLDTAGMPFVTNARRDKDLCRQGYGHMHGMLESPTSFTLIRGTVPVLSTGRYRPWATPAYNESEFLYNESRDVSWERKHNNLYWAGSTTGGYAMGAYNLWKSFHRQRFVALAQGLGSESETHWYLREGANGAVRRVASSFLNSRLWDVAFTRIFQCDGPACGAQRSYFRGRPWADKDAALRSRLAFDTDGNGISGRFGKLLASRSAPLKQTLLREWHDERLAAWVHYVPVSLGMEELPELVNWLTGSATGRKRARAVADAGRAERSQNHPGSQPPWWSLFLPSDLGEDAVDPASLNLDSSVSTASLWPLEDAAAVAPELFAEQHPDNNSLFQLSPLDFFDSAPNSNSASLQSSPEEQLIQDILGLSPTDGPFAVDEQDMAAMGLFGAVHSHGLEPSGDGHSQHHHDMFAHGSHQNAFLGTSTGLQHHSISHRRALHPQDHINPTSRTTTTRANHQPYFAQAPDAATIAVDSSSSSATPASSVHAPSRTYSHQQPQAASPSPSSTGSNKRKQSHSPPAEEDAETVLKRQRNTMAARKYRQKRLDRISDLEQALGEVTGERDELKLQLARREAEVEALREMLARK
ncbi:hypothetical protein ACCO45_012403 [Purpureocillium lilacinum]|uniref:Uncharacterized protein n=1 Tax=Purpureocillium lilacinum TaxID=33203 RepID=A0ACC4DAX8_PURLI